MTVIYVNLFRGYKCFFSSPCRDYVPYIQIDWPVK